MWVRCACALALLSVARAALLLDKRAEMVPVPFVLGSRYGRSPPRQLTPRNDRFFMGSRYGKRSDSALSDRQSVFKMLSDSARSDRQSGFKMLCDSALSDRQSVFKMLSDSARSDRQSGFKMLCDSALSDRQSVFKMLSDSARSDRQSGFKMLSDSARSDRQSGFKMLSDPDALSDRQSVPTAAAGRPGAFSDHQLAQLLGSSPPHRHSPSLLWQAAALLAGRSHRTFDITSS